MRANLKYFLARLALVAFTTLGASVTSFAHDLPDAKALAQSAEAHAAAVAAEMPVVLKAQHSNQPSDQLTVARPDSGVAPRPAMSEAQPRNVIAVAHPDAGDAPRPVRKVAQAALQPQFKSQPAVFARSSEVYMPYDFQLSDWRFGQFPYHGKTASAPTPSSLPALANVPQQYGPPSPQFVALGKFLQRLDQWQCTAYSNLTDDAALARSAKRAIQSLERLAMNYRPAYVVTNTPAALAVARPMSAWAPSALPTSILPTSILPPSSKQPSPAVGPQFVVYESAMGGHIVLTVDQARDWQFDATAHQSRINNALGAALKPIQISALATASRHLEFAGRGLLSLSRGLSSIAGSNAAETRVASLPSRND